ncbi:MarR family winged helix-turn-helix transcriptional regulator [Sanguibacter suaedae]|uniref:MarR family transcriptional regulator n=1 Tax=Sanguibacter suaedae TaxID=2795737 RepID=A0A934M858_9MICO|nr:MarR family transcriptional regulator [Sanguibacter suaedae]MBI9116172.1 MarR family transcriptional regulator [Sanguibacter suaedae]
MSVDVGAVRAWEVLSRAQSVLMRRFAAEDVWLPLSVREYDVLYTLSLSGVGVGVRLHVLNEGVLLSQPSLSRMVERLEGKGFVVRGPDPRDRRGTVVSLTAEGLRVQRVVGRRHARSISEHLGAALDASELATLEELCARLLRVHGGGSVGVVEESEEVGRGGRYAGV